MVRIIQLGLFFILLGCSDSGRNEQFRDLEFKEIGYGVYTSKLVSIENDKDSPTGNHQSGTGHVLHKRTNHIKAFKGMLFGVQYVVKSTQILPIKMEAIWIFPAPIINEKGEHFTELRREFNPYLNDTTFAGYAFEKDYEIVKGLWRYQLRYKGEIVYQRDFYIE